MNSHSEKEKSSYFLFASCWIVYMIVCMSKTNYTASIAYIVKEGIFSKSDSGVISAAFYLMYGISQFFGGAVADRFSPYRIMTVGIAGSIITNLALVFTTDFNWVLILWSLTGLIQFGVWPSAARIVAGVLIPEHRKKAGVYITLAIGVGGILSYLFVTSVLEGFGWGGVFVMNVLLLFGALLLWKYAQKHTEKILMPDPINIKREKMLTKSEHKFTYVFFASGLFLIVFLGIGQALLDNGVKSWVPTMMMESYSLSPTWASVQTAVMYVCNIFGVFLLVRIFRKVENPVLVQSLYFVICLPACALMIFVGKIPFWIVFVLLIISTSVTYAMTNISVRIASAFNEYGYSATVSGIINAVLCFGIVIGNGGYGYVADHFGWSAVTAIWLIVCTLSIAFGFASLIFWKRFFKNRFKTSEYTDMSYQNPPEKVFDEPCMQVDNSGKK